MSSTEEPVSLSFHALRNGLEEQVEAVWERYFPQLVRVAQIRLAGHNDAMADEEDVALSVMNSFFIALQNDRFPDLNNSDDLGRLLSKLTKRKAIDYLRRAHRMKRTGKRPNTDDSGGVRIPLEELASDDPTPELAMLVADECEYLLSLLDEPLQRLALQKLEGRTNEELATIFDRSEPTIRRWIKIIRKEWSAARSADD